MIGDAGDGSGEIQVQLLALVVLLAESVLVLKDGGGESVDVVLGDIVPGDDYRAHGHRAGIHGGGALAAVITAAGGQGKDHGHCHEKCK